MAPLTPPSSLSLQGELDKGKQKGEEENEKRKISLPSETPFDPADKHKGKYLVYSVHTHTPTMNGYLQLQTDRHFTMHQGGEVSNGDAIYPSDEWMGLCSFRGPLDKSKSAFVSLCCAPPATSSPYLKVLFTF